MMPPGPPLATTLRQRRGEELVQGAPIQANGVTTADGELEARYPFLFLLSTFPFTALLLQADKVHLYNINNHRHYRYSCVETSTVLNKARVLEASTYL